MYIYIKKTLATIGLGIIPGIALSMVMASLAWALSAGTNISLENGTIALTGQVGVANGGSGLATYTAANKILVSTGATALTASALPADCEGSDKAVSYDDSDQTFGCSTIPSAGTNTQFLSFQSETKVDVDNSGTNAVYIGAGGRVSTTVGNVQTVINGGGDFDNLACTLSGNPAANLKVELVYGTCGTLASASTTQTVTFASGGTNATIQAESGAAQTVDAAKCVALKVSSPDGNPSAVFVNCNIEKS